MGFCLTRMLPMETTPQPRPWKILLAFAIIYLVWGSTFLAIRVGVREVPPFLFAGMRFFAAGIVLYAWMRAKATAPPTARQWAAASLLAVMIFTWTTVCSFGRNSAYPRGWRR
jgi:drug/metabolite transporter (DMT)-like permease